MFMSNGLFDAQNYVCFEFAMRFDEEFMTLNSSILAES